jgi:signal transduction histidine kinase
MRERAPRKYRRHAAGNAVQGSGVSLVSTEQVELATRLAALLEVIHSAASQGTLEDLAQIATERVAEAFQLTRMALWRVDWDARRVRRLATYREPITNIPDEVPLDEATFLMWISGKSRSRVVQNMDEMQEPPVMKPYTLPPGPLLVVPLVRQERVIGMMTGDRSGGEIAFTEQQLALADGIASQMAMAIENTMLHEEERRRRLQVETILQELTGAVTAFDEQGRLTLSNANEKRFFDLTDDEARLGQHVSDYLKARDEELLDGTSLSVDDNPASRALRGERVRDLEHFAFDKERNPRIIRTTARPLIVNDEVIGAVSISHDITAERDAEERDRRHREQLERSAQRSQAIADLVMEITAGQDIQSVADTALRRIVQELGADAGLMTLRDESGHFMPYAIYGERMENIPRQGIDLMRAETSARALAERRPLVVPAWTLSLPDAVKHKYADDALMLIVPMQIRGHGLGISYVSFHRAKEIDDTDLTYAAIWGRHCSQAIDKVTLMEQLESSHRRLLTIIDQLVQGVMILDAPDGNVAIANQAAQELWGRSLDDEDVLAGELPVVDDEGLPIEGNAHPFLRPLHSREATVGEPLKIVRPDGGRVEILASHSPLFDVRGEIIGSVSVLQNRSDFKPLDRAKDEFISVIAHELRNPLTSLRGNLQLLQRRLRKRIDERTEQDLERIESIITQVDRIGDLVSRMLDVSRVDLGSLDVTPEPTDAAALVRTVVVDAKGLNPGRPFAVRSPETVPVVWDAARVQQVLANLMQNAARYAPDGPVEIDVEEMPDDRVRISVRDHGPGVPLKIRERLFKQYYRFDDGQDARVRATDGKLGLGIGLYISARLARAHGGSLTVDDAVGGGAVFTLELPREANTANDHANSSPA